MPFPSIDPIALQLGPLAIRWYSLAYIAGIFLGWYLIKTEHQKRPVPMLSAKALDDVIVWAVAGIILGGRLGYVCFYQPAYYAARPLEALYLWQGGMSFHGGLLGTITAFYLFCRRHKVAFFHITDLLACAAPIGLFFGRIANFINGELYGRSTDAPWGIIFPHGDNFPRHPSQLYEAGMEGAILFILMFLLLKKSRLRNAPGALSGVFLAGYAIARMIAECFREPDVQIGYLAGGITMGQLLSLPMLALGMYLFWRGRKRSGL